MKVIRKGIIYYSTNICNPFVRTVIRCVLMVDRIYVEFEEGEKTIGRWDSKEVDIKDLLDRIAQDGHVHYLLNDDAAIAGLQKLINSDLDIKRVIEIIINYLFSLSAVDLDDEYIKMWTEMYGRKKKITIRNKTKINLINYKETTTYLKLFEAQKLTMKEIDNATATLLYTIPCDVNTIADIGSGPGFVNQYIPYYYDVLAIDINEEILALNKRPICIGDILDLPLIDQSVDMTISCDVLEHIEPDKLEIAVKELKRVSRKYIYIQVPFNEILRYGVAKCPKCGNIWHVNFHKNSFDLADLKYFEDDGWEISQVNYTGYVYNETENSCIYDVIEKKGLDIYRVEGFECPKCGAESKVVNYDLLQKMEIINNADSHSKRIFPRYTEIGVLFRKRVKRLNLNEEVYPIKKEDIFSNCYIDFNCPFVLKDFYTGKEQIPLVIAKEGQIKKEKSGIRVKSEISIAFPFRIENSVLEIRGYCGDDVELRIVGLNNREEEFIENTNVYPKGIFFYKHRMSSRWKKHSTLIRIYSDKSINLFSIRVLTKEEREYYVIEQCDVQNEHYIKKKNGIKYCYYIPQGGIAFEKEGSEEENEKSKAGLKKNNKKILKMLYMVKFGDLLKKLIPIRV